MQRFLKISFVFLLLAAIIISANMSVARAVARPVKEHLGFLATGDISGAYALTSREFKEALSLDEYKNFVIQFPFLTKNKGYKFSKRTFNNNIGKVKSVLFSEGNIAIPVVFTLVKEKHKWKIISIAINPKDS